MKKLLIYAVSVVCTLTAIAQTQQPKPISNEQKAKNLITRWTKENIGDVASYQPISFGTLEKWQRPVEQDTTYLKMLLLGIEAKRLLEEVDRSLKSYGISYDERYKLLTEKSELILMEGTIDTMIKNHKQNYVGEVFYQIAHKYRAKNKFAGIEIFDQIFTFDLGLTKVISVKDVEK